MSNTEVYNAADKIDDLVAKTRNMVDHAELYPDSSVSFQEIRLVLNTIADEAGYIMSLTKPVAIEPVSSPEEIWEQNRLKRLPDEEVQDV